MFEAFGALEHLNHFTFFFLMNFKKKRGFRVKFNDKKCKYYKKSFAIQQFF